ncbi:ChaN family lipoprotein [Zeaxanthinibacter sp. PT1]|uniref:ChaN family lipoprotein n=1 Tax=Zeaxanthinibacter TaxID=561554 RepID=UPI002349FE1D|nr:ChaN family lipoprotein [Zeaxanthinibacter sp. PT1]MDC6350919.1 ChaN family lipoprotein [Zeaxanthinibacter sp. PT1]
MSRTIVFTISLCLLAHFVFSQDRAYQLFTSKGKKTTFRKMSKNLEEKDIILFGELHDNPIAHWLQLELAKQLHNSNPLLLGAEMIETDNQQALNAYLDGRIDQKGLDSLARLWSNYKTDYAPLVNFARENKLPFIGTNIPRRYASMVYRAGFAALDTLSPIEKKWIAPLPIPFDPSLTKYQEILQMMGDHGSPELVMAQAIKDATMAHSILENYKEGYLFLHFNGSFHSDDYQGILWYLKQMRPKLKYATIATVSQDDLRMLEKEYKGRADFILCVDSDMTTTY